MNVLKSKTPFYKQRKFWLYIIPILIILFVIGSFTNNNDDENLSNSTKAKSQTLSNSTDIDNTKINEHQKSEKKITDSKQSKDYKKFIIWLKQEMLESYGDYKGEQATTWYHYIKTYSYNDSNKVVYVYGKDKDTPLEAQNHIVKAVRNALYLNKEKYPYKIKEIIFVAPNGEELDSQSFEY